MSAPVGSTADRVSGGLSAVGAATPVPGRATSDAANTVPSAATANLLVRGERMPMSPWFERRAGGHSWCSSHRAVHLADHLDRLVISNIVVDCPCGKRYGQLSAAGGIGDRSAGTHCVWANPWCPTTSRPESQADLAQRVGHARRRGRGAAPGRSATTHSRWAGRRAMQRPAHQRAGGWCSQRWQNSFMPMELSTPFTTWSWKYSSPSNSASLHAAASWPRVVSHDFPPS